MTSTGWRSAPEGSVCCFLCHRYQPPEKVEAQRCLNRESCQRAAAAMVGRPRQVSRKHAEAYG